MTLYKNDLPDDVFKKLMFAGPNSNKKATGPLAVDTETLGLDQRRDRLCVVQVNDGTTYAAVQLERGQELPKNLIELLSAQRLKVMHYAPFDIGMIGVHLGVWFSPADVYCTRTGNRIARTAAPGHGLQAVVKDLLGIELAKTSSVTDWGAQELTPDQLQYAEEDTKYLIPVMQKQIEIAAREGREELLKAVMVGLVPYAVAHAQGWPDIYGRGDK